jgi:HAD superfamily hydrolase (TIGR01549 family)
MSSFDVACLLRRFFGDMTEAVIFDVDGTIVDSVDLHAQAWQAAFEKFGKIIPFQSVRRQIGKGSDQLLPVFFSKQELAEFGEELDKYRGDLFKREYLPRVKGFPKVRDLFERLKQDRKQIGLASSAKPDELKAYKKAARIEDLIETETSSGDAEKSKPHPDIFQAARDRLPGVAVDRIIVVGDTPYDAEAAAKAKLRTLGMLSGGWQEEKLRRAGCIAVYRDPADLLARYDESPLR